MDFFSNNRKNVLKEMDDNSCMILYSGNPQFWSGDMFYKFSVDKNFYYLTGLEEDNYILFLEKRNNISKIEIFIDKKDEKYEKFNGVSKSKDNIYNKTHISNISFISEFNINNIIKEYEKIYMQVDKFYYKYTVDLLSKIKKINNNIKLVNVNEIIYKQRAIKQEYEIDNIKKAINITNNAIRHILKNVRPNIYEYQIEALYDYAIKNQGVKELAFESIVAGGKNGTVLHYCDNDQVVKDNELVLLDLGVKYNNYCSDISRTIPVSGKYTKRQKDIYSIVLDAQKESIKFAKPEMSFGELNSFTKHKLACGCKSIGLIENEYEIEKYYFHSVSHQLGIDAHDLLRKNSIIQEGMVITIEPGLYIPEESIGIRIEDDILIKKYINENLSYMIPKEIDEIESLINSN